MKTKKSISLILALVLVLALACGAWADLTTTLTADGSHADPNERSKTANDNIVVSGDAGNVFGAQAAHGGILLIPGFDVTVTATANAQPYTLDAWDSGDITMTGDVEADGFHGIAVFSRSNSSIVLTGDVRSNNSTGLSALDNSTIVFTGNIFVSADYYETWGISSRVGSVVTMKNGTLEMTNGAGWHLYVRNGVINLDNVTIDDDNPNLMTTYAGGTVNVENNSVLVGDIIHHGTMESDTFEVNFSDSTWDGAVDASGDIGLIDITLKNSDWNITGDSSTNGKVTADSDSNIDFRGTDENIVVEIDSLAGAPGLNIKLGDELIIKNQTGNTPSTTTPDIISIVENPDGSISIIPKGDGTGDLTYQYVDDNGDIQTVTIGVVSGSGVKPAGGSGGSSGCNAGFGVLALLGLAFVYKKK